MPHCSIVTVLTNWFTAFLFQQGHTSMVSCPPPPPRWPQGSRRLVEWVPLHHMPTSIQLQCMTTDRESLPSQDGHQRGCRDNLHTVLVCMECLHASLHTHATVCIAILVFYILYTLKHYIIYYIQSCVTKVAEVYNIAICGLCVVMW